MPAVTRVAIETLGCKLNQAETEALAREISSSGFCVVASDEEFDVYILNSCSVTSTADAKARHLLRLAHRRSPQAALILTGCFPAGIENSLPELKMAIPNYDKHGLVIRLVEQGYLGSVNEPARSHRTRAFIKVQEGCSNFCAYCIVPSMRGREKNRPPHEVLGEINRRVNEGCKEVVLTGTEIGAYRYADTGLAELIANILENTEIARLRISSLQPPEITPGLLANWQNPRLCPHFHLSLQSGSDSVLRRMKRRYDASGFENAVAAIRAVAPDAAITTDVITGFPGETDEEFEDGLRFCEKQGFARIHVFTFSPRPGTAAAIMPGQVAEKVKQGRTRSMLALARESALKFQEGFLGKRLKVLWEQEKRGVWSGYTGNYIRIYARDRGLKPGKITLADLKKPYRDGLLADRVGDTA